MISCCIQAYIFQIVWSSILSFNIWSHCLVSWQKSCDLLVIVVFSRLQRRGKDPTEHFPEVILNNFTTRLGHSIGRQFAALFPQDPQFVGRQVATFHNQRDFVFFRFHRWVFQLNSDRPCILSLVFRRLFKTIYLKYIWSNECVFWFFKIHL